MAPIAVPTAIPTKSPGMRPELRKVQPGAHSGEGQRRTDGQIYESGHQQHSSHHGHYEGGPILGEYRQEVAAGKERLGRQRKIHHETKGGGRHKPVDALKNQLFAGKPGCLVLGLLLGGLTVVDSNIVTLMFLPLRQNCLGQLTVGNFL